MSTQHRGRRINSTAFGQVLLPTQQTLVAQALRKWALVLVSPPLAPVIDWYFQPSIRGPQVYVIVISSGSCLLARPYSHYFLGNSLNSLKKFFGVFHSFLEGHWQSPRLF